MLGGRLYSSHRALNIPAPNYIAASAKGIATLWHDQVLITDQEGALIRKVAIPASVEPTQMLWVGDDLWVADYRTKKILVIGAGSQHWLVLKGPRISAQFKIHPDFGNGRLFVSNGAGHNLQVYDPQGNFRFAFGQEGRQPGQLMFPNQFLLEESGNLLIANTKSPAIDRYSPEGKFLARVVVPTGDAIYRYPTKVALAPDRIVTLEEDGFLQDGRLALYTAQGKYLGSQEPVEDFKLIGDMATWGDRVFATDLKNAKVYAFAAADLHFLGEYSPDLKRIGAEYQKDFRRWDRLSTLCLWGLLAILIPLVYFYARFRKNRAALPNLQSGGTRSSGKPLAEIDQGRRPGILPPKKLNGKAALLSALFPGLGQVYKRQIVKGLLFMGAFTVVAFILAVSFEPILAGSVEWTPFSIFGMGMILFWCLVLYASGIWDAWKNR